MNNLILMMNYVLITTILQRTSTSSSYG